MITKFRDNRLRIDWLDTESAYRKANFNFGPSSTVADVGQSLVEGEILLTTRSKMLRMKWDVRWLIQRIRPSCPESRLDQWQSVQSETRDGEWDWLRWESEWVWKRVQFFPVEQTRTMLKKEITHLNCPFLTTKLFPLYHVLMLVTLCYEKLTKIRYWHLTVE